MSVTVIRKKERVNSEWTELEVYIDGEKKLSIMGNGSSEVQLEKDSGELKVKNFMSKSVRKQVDSGDTVRSFDPSGRQIFHLSDTGYDSSNDCIFIF